MLLQEFPVPDPAFDLLAPLWKAAAQGEFCLPRCAECGQFNWYPEDVCMHCGGRELDWQLLSGRGRLFSWAVVHRALHPPLGKLGRYVSAIVSIEEVPNVRFVTRIVDCEPEDLSIDMPVEVCFHDLGYPAMESGIIAPFFRPIKQS